MRRFVVVLLAALLLAQGVGAGDHIVIGTPGGVSQIAATASFAAMEQCLESTVTTDCYLVGYATLPPGHNVITWRTGNYSAQADAEDRKSLWCVGGGWQGTDDTVADTATLTFDVTGLQHDAEVAIHGCDINGTETDVEPVLRIHDASGVADGDYFRITFDNVHFNGRTPPTSTTILVTSTAAVGGLFIHECFGDQGTSTGNAGPFIHFLGAHGGSFGQGGRFEFTDSQFVGSTLYAFWDSEGDVGGTLPTHFGISNTAINAAHVGASGYVLGTFIFGAADVPAVTLDNARFYQSTSQNLPAIFVFAGTGATEPRMLTGSMHVRMQANVHLGAIYGVAGSGKGPNIVDLRVDQGGTTGTFKSIAWADTGATVGAELFNVSVAGRTGLPSGSDFAAIFDRTFTDKLISEGTANGTLTLNGKSVPVVAGMIGSPTFGSSYLFSRTFSALALNTDYPLFTFPAAAAGVVPMTINRAACVTEDATGSAVFSLWKTTFAGNPMTAAALNCGFRKTDATATDCTGPSCTGGVEATATLTTTAGWAPDDKSIVCSSTTPATSFQIGPDGSCRNRTNVTDCSKTIAAQTILWTPTATVSADLTCTYDYNPTTGTNGWHFMTQNNALTGAELIGLRAGAGFGASGKTRIWIEAKPAF